MSSPLTELPNAVTQTSLPDPEMARHGRNITHESLQVQTSSTAQSLSSTTCHSYPLPCTYHCQQQPARNTRDLIHSDNEMTNLKIRITVLENDLQHCRADELAIEKALRIVVESMGRCNLVPNNNTVAGERAKRGDKGEEMESVGSSKCMRERELEEEIGRLKNEAKHLRSKIREYGVKILFSSHGNGKGKGREAEHHRIEKLDNSLNNNEDGRKGERAQSSTASALIRSWTSDNGDDEAEVDQGENGYETADERSESVDYGHADVGIHSLDEVLGREDDDESPMSTEVLVSTSKASTILTTPDIACIGHINGEKHIQGHPVAQTPNIAPGSPCPVLVSIDELPKPSIIKVGFTTEGCFSGAGYNTNTSLNSNIPDQPQTCTTLVTSFNSIDASTSSFSSQRLWHSRKERDAAVNTHARLANVTRIGIPHREGSLPEFFRHGICYIPPTNNRDYFRTVHISNLPVDVHLRDILARVRGGGILTATLLDTRTLIDSMSARVIFKMGHAAEEYASFAKRHPIIFRADEEDECIAEVTLVGTPTFPVPVSKRHYFSASRCLKIENFPEQYPIARLERWIGKQAVLMEIWLDEEGTLHLQFASIEEAERAWKALSSRERFVVECETDPCSGTVEELLEKVPARRPLFPRMGEIEVREKTVADEVVGEQTTCRSEKSALLKDIKRVSNV